MTTADTMKNIQQDITALGRSTAALAKVEATDMAKKLGIGGALLGLAGFLALNALSLLFVAASLGFFLLLQPDGPVEPQDPAVPTGALPLGFVIMAAILLLVAGGLGFAGMRSIKANRGLKQTQAEVQATVTALKGAVERGKADVAVRLQYGDDRPRSVAAQTHPGTVETRSGDVS
ncbi:hypothetical protein GC722_12980 [Auraticoccus sp. F435]|uniref:Phage holin family protein n=1 Tax=Auraticoccus cholistanensis TaxID=2656650 RepID=A0A6A9V1D6_9ACTN|nr:phage holin family protein [Auraticoccus cholistanensis]MVA76930.1 hypothetical protein [Auraticoccus cholistanensis]